MDWMGRALELESQMHNLKKQVDILSVSNFDMVREFHRVFSKTPDPDEPTVPEQAMIALREHLITEEYEETLVELRRPKIDLAKLAKELADLLVVVYGTAAAFGIDMDAVFAAVHRSNMSKLDDDGKPIYRQDGKVLKSKNYRPPDFQALGLL